MKNFKEFINEENSILEKYAEGESLLIYGEMQKDARSFVDKEYAKFLDKINKKLSDMNQSSEIKSHIKIHFSVNLHESPMGEGTVLTRNDYTINK
jgi:phosphatidate phosphatase PAH1